MPLKNSEVAYKAAELIENGDEEFCCIAVLNVIGEQRAKDRCSEDKNLDFAEEYIKAKKEASSGNDEQYNFVIDNFNRMFKPGRKPDGAVWWPTYLPSSVELRVITLVLISEYFEMLEAQEKTNAT
jgi:hypothetical protein